MITLDELRVANPCSSAIWSDATDDDRARLCKTCNKDVYNLSLMTLDEANDLIREKEGKLCISLYHSFKGKVLTADSPKLLRGLRRKYIITRAKTIALAFAIWGFITGTTTSCRNPLTVGLPKFHFADFQADINGNHWENQDQTLGVKDTTANLIWINATAADSGSMWIFLDSTERTPGNYKDHHIIPIAGGYNDHMMKGSHYWYTGGELKIINIDSSRASGTFWFTANRGFDTVRITNGSFDVPISYGKIPH